MHDIFYIAKLFKAHWVWLLGGGVLALVATLAGIGLISLAGWLITACALSGLAAPDGIAVGFNYMQPAAEIRALAIIRTAGRYAERVLTHEATLRVLSTIRVWLFERLVNLSVLQSNQLRSGDYLSRLTREIDHLDAIYQRLLLPVVIATLGAVGMVCLLQLYAAEATWIVLLLYVSAMIIIPCIFYNVSQRYAQRLITVIAELRVRLLDQFQGLAELIAYRQLEQFQSAGIQILETQISLQRQQHRILSRANALNAFVVQLAPFVLLIIGANLYQQQQLFGEHWVMLLLCLMVIFELVLAMNQTAQQFATTKTAAARIKALAEPSDAVKAQVPKCNLENSHISLQQLCFRYPGQENAVLHSLSLEIPVGRKIAIIGESGVGKTTLLKLLLGDISPQAGRLMLSGIHYKELNRQQILQHIGVLTQRNQLFATSIRDNLLIGRPEANNEQLNNALSMAGLKQFLKYLPTGLETWLGEDGARVSGGEARRIALARVFLKDAPVLLLDEPTEGLDQDTEAKIVQALKQYSRDKTVILITHKEAVLELVQDVYRLVDGGLIKVR